MYPRHGVGKLLAIEQREIAGEALELFVIHFKSDNMTLRVPTDKIGNVGLPLSHRDSTGQQGTQPC